MTQAPAATPKANWKPIIQATPSKATGPSGSSNFDPSKHITYKEPSQIIKMKDLGFPEDAGVSPVAVCQPFQLFSPEAIGQMRDEIFQPVVMDKCKYSSNIAACQLRGYSPKYAPFIYDAWNNSETLSIISKIAGVDLVPVMDFELGHINVSVKSEEQTKEELAVISNEKRFYADDEGIAGCPWEDDKPIVGWHTDSYPFVCVLMLSDCTNMVGGETALLANDGNVLKVRGPQMGCAVVLQGRYITHQALRALGAQERITMVTSFRPKSPHIRDDTVLTTVRPISDLSELYYGFGEYRMEILEERIREQLRQLRDRRRSGKKMNTTAFKKFLAEQEAFLKHMNNEMVEEDKVQVGYMDEIQIPDVVVGGKSSSERPAKRARVE
ncbi:hypothetical protein BDY21DRAFT_387327 [Lineolata rhizophorae]|uniref:Fe2OG dioxygenase domain-containing protein n=1 Tax=Lineolata rhizophorae TaxID=578093 RepID=A0A6A6NT23_9PEZI|nr:hypothetical protein BDY21DRAFT_387327 [Lineolata rhizophorae]